MNRLGGLSVSAIFLGLASTLVATVGCGAHPAASPLASSDQPVTPAVSLQILDYEGIQRLIASHQGKIVVMDAWATSCPPCVEEFPNLVKLSQKHARNVACISLSFDYEGIGSVSDVQGPVLEFLKQQQATFDNVLSSEESDVLYQKFSLSAVPAVFIYDRAGQLVRRFDHGESGDFKYGDVEKFLGTLLNPEGE